MRSVQIDDVIPAVQEGAGEQYKPAVHYRNSNYDEALDAVLTTVRRRAGVLLLTGDAGTGKTLLIRHAINELHGEVQPLTLFAPRLSFDEILELAARVLHLDRSDTESAAAADPAAKLNRFLDQQFAAGRPVVVFIDDAHTVPEATLLELFRFIRAGADGRLRVQAILSGLPAIEALIKNPALRELLGEGIAIARLLPLAEQEAAEFASLLFASKRDTSHRHVTADAIERIASRSGGIRRLVCSLVDAALMTASLDESDAITADTVDEAVTLLSPAWSWKTTEGTGAPKAKEETQADQDAPLSEKPEHRAGADVPELFQDASRRLLDPLLVRAFERLAPSTAAPVSDDDAEVSVSPILRGNESAYSRTGHHVEVQEMKESVLASAGSREKPASRTDHLNKVLKNLQHGSPDVEAAALISEDGLMIASALPQELDETRVAGMSATLLSLGTRAAHELGRGHLQEIVVRGVQGYAVMVDAGRGVLLLVVTNENAKLGLIFFDMREAVNAIRRIL